MRLKNKSKVEVYLTDENKAKLKSIAEKSGTTMAEIIKRALEVYLK